jgi:hypothetical protein
MYFRDDQFICNADCLTVNVAAAEDKYQFQT